MSKKYRLVKYPVKIGYNDKSGRDENIITDASNETIVGGWGDCCGIGGIQEKNIAKIIVKLLNEHRPQFKVSYYERVEE